MGYGCWIKAGNLIAKDEGCKDKILALLREIGADAEEYPAGSLDLEVIDCTYGNYHEEDYEELAEFCRDGSYLDFFGDDDCAWSLVIRNGKIDDISGSVEWNHEPPSPPKIAIPLDSGYELVAEANADSDYKEIFLYLRKDGMATQDLAIVGEQYTYDDDSNVKPIHGAYSVKVYSDPGDENYKCDFGIGRWEEEEV